MKTAHFVAAALLITVDLLTLRPAKAQQFGPDGIARTESQRHDLPEAGEQIIQVRVDFAPGASFPYHTHPGIEVAYVLQGTVEYQFSGQAPITLHAGDSLYIPEGTSHTARNAGTGNAAELATYLVDKNRQLVVKSGE